MPTPTSRLALLEPIGADTVSELRLSITNHATTLDNAAIDQQGALTSRPAAGTTGRYYKSTDAGALDRDNGTIWENIVSSGDLKTSAAASTPGGWLLCDGTAYSRTTYAALFTAIGTAYGSGDGSTTFNVPDFRGRVIIGAGSGAGLTARSRGQTGGEETHQLDVAELASHAHDFSGYHVPVTDSAYSWVGAVAAGGTGSAGFPGTPGGAPSVHDITTTDDNGSGTAHNNMQPFGVANMFIKT